MSEKIKKVLLVEDDPFIRDIYSVKFSQEGFEVSIAENGLEALKKIEESVPDVILLDIVMPYMDGMETLKNIRGKKEWKKIPVVMLTNISEKEKISESEDFGINDYLIKSHFTPSEVVQKVRNLLKG
ncbi:MAG TPA: response regulator transcription factor [Candidatus Moranbacteria bacterium]|nr:response regulator transcription factor [Candidatus Moranbacteria bacterium]HRZ34111.1 response regulator transcription factor [Candidatus Moranbacteria bacterium]